jgi:hypothetical protein
MSNKKVVNSTNIGNPWQSSTSYNDNRRKQNTKSSNKKRK